MKNEIRLYNFLGACSESGYAADCNKIPKSSQGITVLRSGCTTVAAPGRPPTL